MKKAALISICFLLLVFAGCKKKSNDDSSTTVNADVAEQQVLTDFANVLVNPNYQDIQVKAAALNVSVQALSTSATDVNLAIAQSAWRAVRVPWEQAEGFLFGPVEDFNYDPATDTWPVNTVELDSLLNSGNSLTVEDIDSLQFSLKGYHAVEYILFGVGGARTASQLSVRELQYLVSLTQSLYAATTELRNSWDPAHGNFTNDLVTAGAGSSRFATRKDAFLAIVISMAGICNEVANGKMKDAFDAHDSTLVESQYAHNATVDFTNNITGIQNAYMCKYNTTGHSLHDLVAAKEISLDNFIRSEIGTAITSLNAIDPDFGKAIYTQQGQIINAQSALNNLNNALNLLVNFIHTNIKD